MSLLINSKAPKAITIGGKAVKSISINGDVVWKNGPDYFYLENRSGAANTIRMGSEKIKPNEWLALEYSTDKETWTSWDFTRSISLAANSKVYFRGNNTRFSISSSNYHYFESTGDVYAGGSVISLFDKTVPMTKNSNDTMFAFMFYNMTHLVGVDRNLFAGINYGTTGNWRDTTNMFYRTFYGCGALVTPPDLSSITSVRDAGMAQMFYGCTNLITAPDLSSITSVGTSGMNRMFLGCTNLITAPDLSSITSVGNSGMNSMFNGCTNLITAPDLSSITYVGDYGMQRMFNGCKRLTTAYAPRITWNTSKTENWLYGVAASGKLYADASIASKIPKTNVSGCPSGWTVVNL